MALRRSLYLPDPAKAKKAVAELKAKLREQDRQAIEKLAYEKWEAAGRPEGDGVNFWLEAEKEFKDKKYGWLNRRPLVRPKHEA